MEKYKNGGITSIAFPKLGCDKGGLDWNDVKVIMEKYLEPLDIDVYICLDQDKQAMGVEKQMIDCINNMNNPSWISDLGIKDNIASKIIQNVPIRRFREILKIQGVGKQTYFDLFKYSYSKAISIDKNLSKSNQINVQLNLQNVNKTRNETTETKEENKQESYNNIYSLDNFDTFELIWPYLEQKLQSEQKPKDLADFFKVRKAQMDDWLKKGMDMGKVKKLTKPVRYVLSPDEKEQLPLLTYMNNNEK